jgi:hypothetical protein
MKGKCLCVERGKGNKKKYNCSSHENSQSFLLPSLPPSLPPGLVRSTQKPSWASACGAVAACHSG